MPETSPLVSVILVIRNVERFLPEAIESVLNQTFTDFEFLIVDFGSTDSSKDIADRYADRDPRIRVSQIPASTYIQAKVAAGALPRGRYIAVQDADDISLPERLQKELQFMQANPDVGLLGGAVQWIDSNGNPLETVADSPTSDAELREVLKGRNPFWHPTVLMLREAYAKAGGYRLAFTQSDDYDLWLRIIENYRCANLADVVLKYRIHPGQLSLRKRRDQILCALAAQASATLRKAGKPDPLDNATEVTPEILTQMGVSEVRQKNALADGYAFWIKQMYAAGDYGAALNAADEMFRFCSGYGVNPRPISDVHVVAAKANWKRKRIVSSAVSAARAIAARPSVLGRPFKRLLSRD